MLLDVDPPHRAIPSVSSAPLLGVVLATPLLRPRAQAVSNARRVLILWFLIPLRRSSRGCRRGAGAAEALRVLQIAS